jgi:Domain of unknown function (DUF4386)
MAPAGGLNMITGTSEATLQRAARVIGFTYLLAMATAVFAEKFVRGSLIVIDNAALTAQNIIAHEQLFRVGIAAELLTFMIDIVLIAALFVVLAPVNRPLALVAAFFRLAAETVCVVMALQSLDVLRLLSGADYLRAVDSDLLQALARLGISAHGTMFNGAFVVFGVGSTVFGYLWLTSKYIPKALAVLGVAASALLAAGSFALLIGPGLRAILYPAYMVPMFFFEVGMGFWLLFKGVNLAKAGGAKGAAVAR